MILAEELKFDGIRHGFFSREGGCSHGLYSSLNCGIGSDDVPEAVLENRRRAAQSLGVDSGQLLSLHQVHSADSVIVSEPWGVVSGRPRADAMVTRAKGLAIGVLTADCAPLLFADPEAKVIGAAHAGWKGALGGIVASTLAAMERLGARRNSISAVIGPTISKTAYEVGPEFPAPFLGQEPTNEKFFSPSPNKGRYMFDLPAYLLNRFEVEGIAQRRNLDLCTYSDESRFFSYRRATHRSEPDYGRLLSAIVLT